MELKYHLQELMVYIIKVCVAEDGIESYFSGDVYKWWKENEGNYDSYDKLIEWENSDYTQSFVMPLYKSME